MVPFLAIPHYLCVRACEEHERKHPFRVLKLGAFQQELVLIKSKSLISNPECAAVRVKILIGLSRFAFAEPDQLVKDHLATLGIKIDFPGHCFFLRFFSPSSDEVDT